MQMIKNTLVNLQCIKTSPRTNCLTSSTRCSSPREVVEVNQSGTEIYASDMDTDQRNMFYDLPIKFFPARCSADLSKMSLCFVLTAGSFLWFWQSLGNKVYVLVLSIASVFRIKILKLRLTYVSLRKAPMNHSLEQIHSKACCLNYCKEYLGYVYFLFLGFPRNGNGRPSQDNIGQGKKF